MTRRTEDVGWHRGTAAIMAAGAVLCIGVLVADATQPDRAAWDRARAEAARQALPTYYHSPVWVTIGAERVNLHAVTGFGALPDGRGVVLYPGRQVLPGATVEQVDELVRRFCRVGVLELQPPAGEG